MVQLRPLDSGPHVPIVPIVPVTVLFRVILKELPHESGFPNTRLLNGLLLLPSPDSAPNTEKAFTECLWSLAAQSWVEG